MNKLKFKLWNFCGLAISVGVIIGLYTYASNLEEFNIKDAFNSALKNDFGFFTLWLWLPPVIGIGLAVFFALVNPFYSSSSYGSARWAKLKDLGKMELLAPDGLILGLFSGRYLRYDKDLSALLIAPPGTGKTASLVIPVLLSTQRSMLVHDVKDELWALTSKRRAQMGRVIRFAPSSAETHCFNPLDKQFLNPILEKSMSHIEQIGTMLIKEEGKDDTKVDHWIRGARNLFKMYTMYLIWKNGETTLPLVRKLSLSDPEPQELLHDIIESDGDDMPEELKLLFNKNAGMQEKEFGSVHSTMSGFLDIFADPDIKRTFSKCDFTIAEIRENITTVYLHVPVIEIQRLNSLISMFLEITGNFILSNPDKGKGRVLFLLDEFAWLGRMPSMIKLPSLSRGEGGSVVFVCQSYSQIEQLYGKTAVDTLKDTVAYRMILPQNNEDTAESIAKAIGDETRVRTSTSHQSGKVGVSTSKSGEGHKLIRAQELLSMNEMDCIILAQNHFQTPIKAKQCRWYLDKNMKNLGGKTDLKFNMEKDSSDQEKNNMEHVA